MSRRYHEVSGIFPRLDGDERQEIKDSIVCLGVLEPVKFVQRAGTGKEYIDGVNRLEIADELGIECPEEEYLVLEGDHYRPPDDLEILDYVVARNKERRHLRSSQRAAIAILAGTLQSRYLRKASRNRSRPAPSVDREILAAEGELEGDQARKVAGQHGTNRAYIFKAAKIAEEAPELLKKVRDGDLSVEVAYAQLPSEVAKLAEAAEDGGLLDEVGLPVPTELVPAFLARHDFAQAQTQLDGVARLIKNIARGPGGAYLARVLESVRGSLLSALSTVKFHAPHAAVCPTCLNKAPALLACAMCEGRGWVDLERWELASDEMRERAQAQG